jgi:hypothetical protein
MSISRVPTYTTRQILVDRMAEVQTRLNKAQLQVTTEKKSQLYSGISEDSFRLVSSENTASRTQRFLDNNAILSTRYQSITNSLNYSETSLRDLRETLTSFNQRDTKDWTQEDTNDFNQLQNAAFAALKDLEYYLNVDVDGHYLFGGGKSDSPPFELGFNSLKSFQSVYNGVDVTFPETRAAILSDFSAKPVGAAMAGYTSFASGSALETVSPADNRYIEYDSAAETLTAGTTGAFANFRVGDRIAIEDPKFPENSGYMTITAIDGTGTTITVDGDLTTTTSAVGGTESTTATVKRLAPATISAAQYDSGGPNIALNAAGPPAVYDVTDAAGVSLPFAGLQAGDTVTIGDGAGNRGTYTVATWTDGDTIQLQHDVTTTDVLANWDGMVGPDLTITPASAAEDFGTLTFSALANSDNQQVVGKITSATKGYFSGFEVGMTLTVDGTGTNVYGEPQSVSQDGTAYTIIGISADGSTIEVEPPFEAAGDSALFGPIPYGTDAFNITLTASRAHGGVDRSATLYGGQITAGGSADILQTAVDLGPSGTGDLAAGDKLTLIDGNGQVFRHLTLAADPSGAGPYDLQLLNPDGTSFDNTTFTAPSNYTLVKETTETPPFVTGTLTASNFGTLSLNSTAGTIAAGKNNAFAGLSRGMTILLDDNQNPPATDLDGIYTITDISDDRRTITVEPPPPDGTITSTTGAVMRIGIPEGTRIQVDNSTSNDGYYTVTWPDTLSPADRAAAIAGEKIFTRESMASETVASGTTLAASSYYKGDNLTLTHRADEHRSVTLDVNAADPAIEKAIRALGILAQAVPTRADGTPDPNELQRRLDTAAALLGDAIEHPSNSTEASSDLKVLQQKIGYDYYAITQASKQQEDYLGFLDTRVTNMENVDMFDAVTRMQDELRALEVSFQTFSLISQLSLSNYI